MNIVEGDQFEKWTVVSDVVETIKYNKYIVVDCSCGIRASVRVKSLIDGTSTRCRRCAAVGRAGRMRVEGSGWNTFFYRYKKNAENRGMKWPLSKEEFRYYAEQDCWYCGQKPETRVLSPTQTIEANGIDRRDSSMGYAPGNMVTCCGACNRMKMGLSEQQFLDRARLIARKHEII